MQALIYRGPHEMAGRRRSRRPAPGPGEVLIEVRGGRHLRQRCAWLYRRFGAPRTAGMVMGHEFAGVVRELGPDVHRAGRRARGSP